MKEKDYSKSNQEINKSLAGYQIRRLFLKPELSMGRKPSGHFRGWISGIQ
jgi:hypothetical protein